MKTHSEIYQDAKDGMFKAFPKKPVAYAMVAIMEDGEVFYGAEYGSRSAELFTKVSEIRKNVKSYLDRKSNVAATEGHKVTVGA